MTRFVRLGLALAAVLLLGANSLPAQEEEEFSPPSQWRPESDREATPPDISLVPPLAPQPETVRAKPRVAVAPMASSEGEALKPYAGGGELDDGALAFHLSQSLGRPVMDGIKIGLYVEDADSGERLVDLNGDVRMNPASGQKLLTTAAALTRLGPGYVFPTLLLSETPADKDGTIKGDLFVVGKGNPWFTVEEVYKLAVDLKAYGLTKITGDLVIDDSYFDAVREGPGWEEDKGDSAYRAPMGAMSANFNSVEVRVLATANGQTARVTTIPSTRYFSKIDNRTQTKRKATRLEFHCVPDGKGANKLIVKGVIHEGSEPQVEYLKIDNPPLFAGWTLLDAMKQLGIKTGGKVRTGKAPEKAQTFFSFRSPSLATVVGRINKHSNNHMAEQVLKTLGAEVKGVPGTWEKGLAVVDDFIRTELAYPAERYRIANGSGLGSGNEIPPELLVRVLSVMRKRPELAPEYIASLAVSGRDGTLTGRSPDPMLKNRLRGKTGTMEQVMSVSGYLTTRKGRTLAVALTFNQCKGKPRAKLRLIRDEVMRILADYAPKN